MADHLAEQEKRWQERDKRLQEFLAETEKRWRERERRWAKWDMRWEARETGYQEFMRTILSGFEGVMAEHKMVIAELTASISDMRDEIRANTKAVLKVLDRLDDGSAPA